MDVVKKLQLLNLPKDSFMVVGSGILGALEIREPSDIDLVVTPDIYQQLERQGWARQSWPSQTVLTYDIFDVDKSWYGETLDSLLQRATYVDDIPYLSLQEVYEWKKQSGRSKDTRDIELIEAYLGRHNATR